MEREMWYSAGGGAAAAIITGILCFFIQGPICVMIGIIVFWAAMALVIRASLKKSHVNSHLKIKFS